MNSEWSGEVLIPAANVTGYQLAYEAETWLRRICLTALLLAEGPAWAANLDRRLRERIEEQSRQNSARWYLGVDAEEELLWSTTHGQLAALLRLPSVAAQIADLCGVQGGFLSDRLATIGQIRNALAHNRAISNDTLTILRGEMTVVNAAVGRFKRNTLYAGSDIFLSEFPDDLAVLGAAFYEASSSFPRQQLFLSANDNFVFFVRLPPSGTLRPDEPLVEWPKAGVLREVLGMTSHLLVCVLANKTGDELQLVLPRSLADADKLQVLSRFMTSEVLVTGWTGRSPETQHPADVCWPRLWFYENRPPER